MNSPKPNIIKIKLAFKTTALIVCVGVSLIFSGTLSAQAYILNGGFEISETVPNQSGQWELMNNWTNAGSSLANIESLGDIFTKEILFAFILLGSLTLMPVIIKKIKEFKKEKEK